MIDALLYFFENVGTAFASVGTYIANNAADVAALVGALVFVMIVQIFITKG